MNATGWRPASRLIAVDARAAGGIEPDDAARLVTGAMAAEPTGLLLWPSKQVRQILARLPAHVPVVAVLPDLAKLLSDAVEQGPVRAALGRAAAGGIAAWWRLGLTGLRNVRAIAAQDFAGLVPVLIELERAALGGRALSGIALAAPLTDLLLAAGHRDCFAHIVTFLRRQVGTQAGFETQNLGHLLARLDSWDISPDFVIGPLNGRGFRMKPSTAAVLEAVRASATAVLATEVCARGTVPLSEGVAYVRKHGAAAAVITLDELAGVDEQRR
jgi:hypothetical protein